MQPNHPNFPLPVPEIPRPVLPNPVFPPVRQASGISNSSQISVASSLGMSRDLNKGLSPSNIPTLSISHQDSITDVLNDNQVPNPSNIPKFSISHQNSIPGVLNYSQGGGRRPSAPAQRPSPPDISKLRFTSQHSGSNIQNYNQVGGVSPLTISMPSRANFQRCPPDLKGGMDFPKIPHLYNQTNPSISKEVIDCPDDIKRVIESENYHQEIARKYKSCSIKILGSSIEVSALNKDIQSIKNELITYINCITFGDNPIWYCLLDIGYQPYSEACNQIIENAYRTHYLRLRESTYRNYSLKVEITGAEVNYHVEFAKIGGVHRQVRRQTNNTIRTVKREVDGENLNLNLKLTFTWCWLHDSGDYSMYEYEATYLIEESYNEYKTGQAGKSIAIVQGSNGCIYRIEFATMTQYNQHTEVQRKIKREVLYS